MPKNTYSDEFKADAVRLYETTEGASYSSISEDLGIARSRWQSSRLSLFFRFLSSGSEKDGDLS